MASPAVYFQNGALVGDPATGQVGIASDSNGTLFKIAPDATRTAISDVPGSTTVTTTTGSGDDAPAVQAQINANVARGDTGVHLRGTVRLKTQVTIPASAQGIQIYGDGPRLTNVIIDDSGGNIGDGFLLKNTSGCGIHDLTITAQSNRTAGAAIHVVGGDPNIGLQGFNIKDSSTTINNVNMTKQFNGILVESDIANNYQAWRVFIQGGKHTALASNGTGIWLNTVNGADIHIDRSFVLDETAVAAACIRLSSVGSAVLLNCETLGGAYGLLMDTPASANLTTCHIRGGYYDTAGVANLHIAPNASAGQWGGHVFTGVWFGTSGTGSCVEIAGSKAQFIRFNGCYLYNSPAQWNAKVDAASNIHFNGCNFGAAAGAGGINFTNSASNFSVTGSSFTTNDYGGGNPGLPVGIQIDTGSDHYLVSHNFFGSGVTTPITNTPGTSANRRIVQDNVTV